MGKIPEFQRRSFQSTADPSKISDAGSGLRQISQVSNTAFNAGAQLVIKQKQIQEKEFLAQKGLAYELEVSEAYQAHQTKYAGDPLNKYSEFNDQIKEIKAGYMDQAPTAVSKKMFSDTTGMMNMRLESSNATWENQRVAINTGERTQSALETVQTQALRVADPNQLESLIAKGEGLILPLNDTHPPEKVNEARRKFKFNAAMNSFEGMILDGKYDGAEKLLSTKKYDEHLGDDGIKRLEKMIKTGKASRARSIADNSRMKILDPYGYLKKQKVPYEVFQLEGGESSIIERTNFVNDMNAVHGIKLPFFSPDEISKFKDDFKSFNNSERLGFLESVEKMPANSEKIYRDMGVPKEIAFFKEFDNTRDKELFIQATLAKDIQPSSDVMKSDIRLAVDSSDFGSNLLNASKNISVNSGFRERTQNILKTMERISILKNDPMAGPKFFKDNFNTLEVGESIRLFLPKHIDATHVEDNLEDIRKGFIKDKTKGLDSTAAYGRKRYLENNTMWTNGLNGPALIDVNTGKAYKTGTKLKFSELGRRTNKGLGKADRRAQIQDNLSKVNNLGLGGISNLDIGEGS